MFGAIGILLAVLTFSQVLAAGVVEPGVFGEDALDAVSPASSRIISGWEAYPGQFPYVAHLRFFDSSGTWHDCGGSIIHNNWVITSAFCATDRTHARVSAGVTALTTTPQYTAETREFLIHHLFNPNNPAAVQPYDIAALRLQRALIYSTLVQPIRIESTANAFKDYTNAVLFTMGWGRVSQSNIVPNVMNWVYLRGFPIEECRPFYPSSIITEYHICATGFHFSSQSICTGDDGGPLTQIDQAGEPVLVGIVGYWHGTPCGNGRPSGFNRIATFHEWLDEITGINFDEANESQTTAAPNPSTTESSTSGAPVNPTTEVSSTTVVPPITEVTRPPVTEVTTPPTTAVPGPPITEVTRPPVTEVTTPQTTSVPEPPTTAAPKPDSEESDNNSNESDSSETEEDPEISQILDRLLVKIKVKVKINNDIKKNFTSITEK